MIIKEYRMVLPINIDDYELGHLYTVQKMSRIESTGSGSGVEVVENRPYELGNEKGQYTRKLYHVGERLPSPLKTIANLVFSKAVLIFEEESWNSFPVSKTKFNYKYSKGFNIEINSKFTTDFGDSENIFNLSNKELSARIVDYVDIVNDPVNPSDYREDEDPAKFVSKIKNFGPLKSNWLEELKKNADPTTSESMLNNQKVKYMCKYMLCKVEFPIWGFQSKVERLILDSIIRPLLLSAHKRGWCWQDEYYNLTMDDVRKLEKETEEYLRKKMNGEPVEDISHTLSMTQKTNNVKTKEIKDDVKDINKNDQDSISKKDLDFCESDDDEEENERDDNIDEFYDAISSVSSENSPDISIKKSVSFSNLTASQKDKFRKNSNDTIGKNSNFLRHKIKNKLKNLKEKSNNSQANRRFSFVQNDLSSSNNGYSNVKNDILMLIVHGGNVTCTDTSKQNDFSNFKTTMETVIKTHYSQFNGRIAFRLVSCDSIIKDCLLELSA